MTTVKIHSTTRSIERILSGAQLDWQTLSPRTLDPSLRMDGANIHVAHWPPDHVNRPDIRRRAPAVAAVSAGRDKMDIRDLDCGGPRFDWSVCEDGAIASAPRARTLCAMIQSSRTNSIVWESTKGSRSV